MSISQPNVVLIVLDSVRKDHLSCYGYARRTTPNIDRIASEGMTFTRAYASSCWTIPSHASLFTGLYSSQHGATLESKWLDPQHRTLAACLGSRGYRTAAITCNGFISDHTNLNHGFDRTVDVERLRGGTDGLGSRMLRAVHRRWKHLTRHDRGARRATRLAQRWLRDHDTSTPFFLFVNYMDCHLPYRLRAPARYRFVAPDDRSDADRVPQDPFGYMAGEVALSEQDIALLQSLYDGALYYLDHQVGKLYDRLRALGIAEETIFIVTSDHGESFGEHGLMDHQYGLYEHLLAVPLVVSLPDTHLAGSVRDGLVQLVDVFPTVARLVGDDATDEAIAALPGVSVLEESGREYVLAEYLTPNLNAIRRRYPDTDVSRYDVALRSISDGEYKLIQRSDGQAELYHLTNDPDEHHNVIDRQPVVASQLRRQLHRLLGDWPPRRTGRTEDTDDERKDVELIRDRLESLGYL